MEQEKVITLCTFYLQNVHMLLSSSTLFYQNWRKRKAVKRKRLLNVMYHQSRSVLSVPFNIFKIKRLRMKNKTRSFDWWENIVVQTFTDSDWIENFRVSKSTFNYICEVLSTKLKPKYNCLSNPSKIVSFEKKIAVSLYFLASCCEYRVAGNAFGIHKSTVHNIIHEFVYALNSLLENYISMPTEVDAIEISHGFEKISHLPNIVGLIDGSHIPILPPKIGYRDFINRKGWPSIVLQGVVDHRYRFLDISVKNPGATHDAAVLAKSTFFRNIERLMPQGAVQLNGHELPYVIIGDLAYPLLPWLLKGYINRGLTLEQDSFNAYMNSARVCVENTFGRLKARWRTLLKRTDVSYKFAPHVIATCCILHNIVESRKEKFYDAWMRAVEEADIIFPQPRRATNRNLDTYDGNETREILCQHLRDNYPLRSSRFR